MPIDDDDKETKRMEAYDSEVDALITELTQSTAGFEEYVEERRILVQGGAKNDLIGVEVGFEDDVGLVNIHVYTNPTIARQVVRFLQTIGQRTGTSAVPPKHLS